MPLDVVVVMDPIASIKPAKDSTFAMLLEAQRRGHRLHYALPGSLAVVDGTAQATTAPLEVRDSKTDWFGLGAAAVGRVRRRRPGVDAQGSAGRRRLPARHPDPRPGPAPGRRVVNDPQGLRDLNEKLAALLFPQCCPPTLVSRESAALKAFVNAHGEAVLKPLDGMGGRSIFRAPPASRT